MSPRGWWEASVSVGVGVNAKAAAVPLHKGAAAPVIKAARRREHGSTGTFTNHTQWDGSGSVHTNLLIQV